MKKISSKIFSNKVIAAFRKSTVGTLCIIVVSLFILSAGCVDNGKENESEDEVVSLVSLKDTKWKLTEIILVSTADHNYPVDNREIIDCSGKNIIYDFQTDTTLVITGDRIENSLQNGEYVYHYIYRPHSTVRDTLLSIPSPNLSINGEGMYCGFTEGGSGYKMGIARHIYKDKVLAYLGSYSFTKIIE
jgi:hypothetical protein